MSEAQKHALGRYLDAPFTTAEPFALATSARTWLASQSCVVSVFVGTAGWSIPREHAVLAQCEGSGLRRYSSILGCVEINSTFHRRHQPKTFERWRDSVPPSFRFAVKLPRWITHEAELSSPAEDLTRFFDDVAGLGEKLGPVLIQLPASAPFNARRARAFFKALRARYLGPVACEPRHPGWYGTTPSAMLLEFDVARVVADPARPAEADVPAGSTALEYTRWHGSPRLYWSAYNDEQLATLAQRVLLAPACTAVWCIFDNTAGGSALHDANRLNDILAARRTLGGNSSLTPKRGVK